MSDVGNVKRAPFKSKQICFDLNTNKYVLKYVWEGLIEVKKILCMYQISIKETGTNFVKPQILLSSEEWKADHILIKISFQYQSFNYNHTFL